MVIPHYTYLKLKIPQHAWVIMVKGCFRKSEKYDRAFHQVSDTFRSQQELVEIALILDRSVLPLASLYKLKEITRDYSVDNDTTTHQVHPTDPDKTIRIYAHLP